ncbi:11489_t:CDS:2 [Acaulospora morrowiae]|uniref:11489_t:CDS:1 n=1 Tax=Acaulospora morrowiae TaxID=94023 RepID=A0A9N8V967_9GLOM|nr:11489_t:CDS:2 [Acaulospora morrowiae]
MTSTPTHPSIDSEPIYEFDEALKIEFKESVDDGQISIYTGEISNAWRFRDVPHGGYLISLLLKALMHHFRETNPHPVQLTAHFLRRSHVGPFKIKIVNLKVGRIYSIANAELMQRTNLSDESSEYITCITLTSIFGDLSSEVGLSPPFYDTPKITPKYLCVPYKYDPEYQDIPNLLPHVNALYDDNFYKKKMSECSNWVSFIDGREMDFLSMGLFSDLYFPSPVTNYLGKKIFNYWLATLTLDIQFKHVPKGKWIGGTFRSKFLKNGRNEVDGELYDEEGNLLCISRQMYVIQDPAKL